MDEVALIRKKPVETGGKMFHEGYADGKLYLVPDENLEAMKDLVNTDKKLRRNIAQTVSGDSYEIDDYARSKNKLDFVFEKLEEVEKEIIEEDLEDDKRTGVKMEELEKMEESGVEAKESSNEEMYNNKTFQRKDMDKNEEKEEEIKGESYIKEDKINEDKNSASEKVKQVAKVESLHDDSENEMQKRSRNNTLNSNGESFIYGKDVVEKDNTKENVKEGKESKVIELEGREEIGNWYDLVEEEDEKPFKDKETIVQPPYSNSELDPNRLRFLISGHFRDDRKPIYIIQDFRGGPELFDDQEADFYSKKTEGDIDAYLSGRFFKKSILVESDGNPSAIIVRPYKILVDEKFCSVFDDYFEQIYKFDSFDIILKGEFLKTNIAKGITPFLTLDIKSNTKPEAKS